MAANLVGAGYRVIGFDTNPAAVDRFLEHDGPGRAEVASGCEEVVGDPDRIIHCGAVGMGGVGKAVQQMKLRLVEARGKGFRMPMSEGPFEFIQGARPSTVDGVGRTLVSVWDELMRTSERSEQ
jgi:3-hydroxyisobutyrate dehydrogenase-like beta-hydroxyacid dehydrogenase